MKMMTKITITRKIHPKYFLSNKKGIVIDPTYFNTGTLERM